MYCISRALLFAQPAADAAGITVVAGQSAFFLARIANPFACFKGDQTNDMFGTGIGAQSAAATGAIIHKSHAVLYPDSAERTDGSTAAKSDAAVRTQLVASTNAAGSRTVCSALVQILQLCNSGCTGTHDLCAHAHGFFCFHPHNRCNRRSDLLPANRTGADFSLPFCNCFRTGSAAGIPAAAAVRTRQTLLDLRNTRVLLDRK